MEPIAEPISWVLVWLGGISLTVITVCVVLSAFLLVSTVVSSWRRANREYRAYRMGYEDAKNGKSPMPYTKRRGLRRIYFTLRHGRWMSKRKETNNDRPQ